MFKKNKRVSAPVVNIGSSSLLVIFLILCLVVFAVLTLTSAQKDYQYSQRIAERNTEYYAAVAEAERIWDDFDRAASQESHGDSSYGSESQGDRPSDITVSQGDRPSDITYSVAINDTQELQVVLTLAGNETDGYHYDIAKWQTVSTTEWTGDNSLNLIQVP